LSNTALAPDTLTNPLGLFYHYGYLALEDNVTIEGTLIVHGSGWFSSFADLEIKGISVGITPAAIPSLDGSSQTIELPVLYVADDLKIDDDADTSIRGFVSVMDDFEVKPGDGDTELDFQGRLIVKDLKLGPRDDWKESESWWRDHATAYLDQLGDANPIAYFPSFLEDDDDKVVRSVVRITPDTAGPAYHGHDWSGPLFVAHPNDTGLVWDLIQWTDNL